MGLTKAFQEKRTWRQLQKRAGALPRDYRIVYQAIQRYLLKIAPTAVTTDMTTLADLLALFEAGAQRGQSVLQITGQDVAKFADGLITSDADLAFEQRANAQVAQAIQRHFSSHSKS